MKTQLLILLLILTSTLSYAQDMPSNNEITALDWINNFRDSAMNSGTIGSGHVIIFDDRIIAKETELSVALTGIYGESIKECEVIEKKKSKLMFEDRMVRNGALIVRLEKYAYKRFAQNVKKFEMISASDLNFAAIGLIEGMQMIGIKTGELGTEHLVIIDGVNITSQSQLSAAMEGIYSNSIADYRVVNRANSAEILEWEQVEQGAIVVVLDDKAHKRFTKNIKKFEKKERKHVNANATKQQSWSSPTYLYFSNSTDL